MLKHLYIKNYALIEELDIDFQGGFSVITGETGAGKSILLGAMGQLLGQRADVRSIQPGAAKCVVEAEFELSGFGLADFFQQNGFDFDDHCCIIRRELTTSGKSRAFVNDTPATIGQLKALGAQIIDIHSQHQNLLLANETFQLDVLDSLAQSHQALNEYTQAYQQYRQQTKALQALTARLAAERENKDYIQFLASQLSDFNPQPGEDEALEQEIQTLTHAEDIKTSLFHTSALMSDEPHGILQAMSQARQLVQTASRHLPDAEEWTSRLEEVYIELKDIASEIEHRADSVQYDPQRLEMLNQRQNELQTLERKHKTSSAEGLIEIWEDLSRQLDQIECGDDEIQNLQKALNHTHAQLMERAARLTALRRQSATFLQQQMSEMLSPLGMPNAQLQVEIDPLDTPQDKGTNRVTFLFSANKNAPLRPIAEVASGGEIARVMLTLKTIISQAQQLPTLIFDEIDTGVSGHIAECMARMMQQMASTQGMQVISITHLPQIAALGAAHYHVYKQDGDFHTHTHISQLTPDERIQEIAHMLSGAQVTQAAIDNAKQLLKL